jgi:hypothetical protein
MKDKDTLILESLYSNILLETGILGLSLEDFYKNIQGKTFIFFDTETTGLKSGESYSQITQLAAIAVNLDTKETLDTYSKTFKLEQPALDQIEKEKINPNPNSKVWPIEKTLAYNKYDSGKATHTPSEDVHKLLEWINKFPNPVIIAQNAQFDMGFLNTLLKKNHVQPLKHPVMDLMKFNRIYLEPILNNLVRNDVPEAVEKLNLLKNSKGDASFAQDKLGVAFEVGTKGAHDALHDVEQMIGLVENIITFIKQHFGKLDQSKSEADFGIARKKWRDEFQNFPVRDRAYRERRKKKV